jgi:hypothetical protein
MELLDHGAPIFNRLASDAAQYGSHWQNSILRQSRLKICATKRWLGYFAGGCVVERSEAVAASLLLRTL